MNKNIFYFLFAMLVIFSACNRSDDPAYVNQENPIVPTGKIVGKVFAKNGVKTIGGALLFTLGNDGQMYNTYSAADGTFVLEAPTGMRNVQIQTGTGENFRTEISVEVKENQTTTLPADSSKLNQIATMAYVDGTYDEIEDIIVSLGYTATQISYADLQNMTTISQYDIIFLNCGSRPNNITAADQVVYDNLGTFVSNGGSLYASDWSVAYLVGGAQNTTMCNASGGFIPDSKLCSQNTGSSGILQAMIPNTNLSTALGFSTLDINYDLGAWQKIINYDPTYWDVLVSNPVNGPLMIRTNQYTNPNAPNVNVGTSTNNNFITICHNPSGNNPITITINQNAWAAHQAHGDTLGACSGNATSGNIFFTTFHNHANGNIGNSGLILQYIILNL